MTKPREKFRVFLVDDEPLALKRLARLLLETNRIEIVGQCTRPVEALRLISADELDAIFLDIQMPGLTGFEFLTKLKDYPPIIFTTAFDEYALRAFEFYSIDYLLKPIESERLQNTLEKLEKIIINRPKIIENIENLLSDFSSNFSIATSHKLERVASQIGGKVRIVEVSEITHFFARDKLTFAKDVESKEYSLNFSLNELETKLDKNSFLRIHRSSIVNISFIKEVHGWFSGKILICLKDAANTKLVVARERVKILKDFLGI